MKNIYLSDKHGYPQFRIFTKKINGDTSVDFEVYEITSWKDDKKNTPFEEELYLTTYMKWDNCNHFWFGEKENDKQDGYLHICGSVSMENHLRLMAFLYDYAFRVMKREPEEKLTVKLLDIKE